MSLKHHFSTEAALLIALVVPACSGSEPDARDTGLTSIGPSGTTTGMEEDTRDDGEKLDVGVSDIPLDPSDGDCAAQTLEAEVEHQGVDVILVVDTSNSMASAIASVEASINSNFAAILEASGVDYRLVVIGKYPPGDQRSICISMPLSASDCNPPPPVPAVTDRYKHYDDQTGSGALLASILAWYTQPDPHGLAPGGYVDFLREGTRKVFLVMTDGNSASNTVSLGDDFDASLLALQPSHFGTPGDRQYVFHTIITMQANDPVTTPWLPDDPLQGNGRSIQQVSVLSGGWRFPLAQHAHFGVLFEEIAQDVVASVPIECSFPIPEPPEGEVIDPNTIEVDYYPGGVPPSIPLHQVVGPQACDASSFYIDSGMVFVCPAACDPIQGDVGARLEVRYGCDVGFDPAG